MRRITTMSLLTAALLLVTTVPALAAPPLTFTDSVEFEDVPCGGGLTYDVALTIDGIERVSGTTETVHLLIRGEIVASDGTVLRVHHAFTESFDTATGTWTGVGTGFGEFVDGSPVHQIYAGRLVAGPEGFTAAGRHPDGPLDPEAETCALLTAAAS